MKIEAPPIHSTFAETADIMADKPLPPNKVGQDWLDWFYSVLEALQIVPSKQGILRAVAHSDDIPVTPIVISSLGAGLWRVSYIARVVVPGSVSGDFQVSIHWPQGGVNQTETGSLVNGNTTTTHETRVLLLRVDSGGPISVSVVHNSGGATEMQYELDVVVEEVLLDSA